MIKSNYGFYRSISDHHTDLLKIVGHVLSVIGFFGTLLFACRYGLDLEKFFNNHPKNGFITLFVWMKSIPNLISVLYGLMIGIWFYKITRFVLEVFPSLFFIISSILIGSIFIGLDIWIYLLLMMLFFVFLNDDFYILLHYILHGIGVFVSSLIALVIIDVNPKYILGVGNLFGEEAQTEMENFIVVAYSIIMLLLLFSLQKTARKNSIFHG